MTHPLDDPAYVPEHPPVDGTVPPVVQKWGAASQVRWFRRYLIDLRPQPPGHWEQFHCNSVDHRGSCCPSCVEDGETFEDSCCCRGIRVKAGVGT